MTELLETALIYKGERARPLVKSNVESLALSMRDIGLINPICVRKISRFHAGTIRDCYEIVAGGHRYAAAVKLGWNMVEATVIDSDDIRFELAEIDENLIRANLSPAESAIAIARRKEIYEEIHPETKHGAIGNGRTESRVAETATLPAERFTKATADAIGKGERTVQKMAERGKKLKDDLNDIVGTSLDNVRDLDELAKMDESDRRPLIKRAKEGEHVTVKRHKEPKIAADPLPDQLASEKQVARLMDAWNAAGPDARQEFLLRIDQPVFDRG